MTLPFGQKSFPETYEEALVGPLFRPFAELVIEAIKPARGEQVLDIACGTGIVARLARERVGATGKVVGVDANPGMLGVARTLAPGIDWRQADAAALPLAANEQFDVVTCHQGLQFFPDKPAAVREMRRALKPGGRLAVATWVTDEGKVLLELRRIAERQVGPVNDRRHSYGDPALLETLLRDGGFNDVRSKSFTRTVRFQDGSVFVRLNAMALVGMSEKGGAMNEAERGRAVETITRDSAELVKAHTSKAGFAYDLGTVLASGTKKH